MSSLGLAIRCPHQQNEDLAIKAKSDWTVRQLKIYLANVHPSKPTPERQRIVFAGQLLRDDAQLGEYFQRYDASVDAPIAENSPPYVLHMVYTNSVENNLAAAEQRGNEETELRRRRPITTNIPTVPIQQNLPSNTTAYAPYWPWPSDPQQQMATSAEATNDWFQQQQQMYMAMNTMMSQWYGQYMQAMYGGPAGIYPFSPVQTTNSVVNDAANQQQEQEPVPQQVPPAQAQRQPAMNAQGGLAPADADDDDPRNRDWLDYVYMSCRAGLLLMILYFYSSVERFVFVLLCCTLMYALQAGWFGRRNQQERQQQRAAGAQAALGGDGQLPNEPQNQDGGGERQAGGGTERAAVREEQPEMPLTAWNVFWTTCWTFISSFFASLVPERPPPLNL